MKLSNVLYSLGIFTLVSACTHKDAQKPVSDSASTIRVATASTSVNSAIYGLPDMAPDKKYLVVEHVEQNGDEYIVEGAVTGHANNEAHASIPDGTQIRIALNDNPATVMLAGNSIFDTNTPSAPKVSISYKNHPQDYYLVTPGNTPFTPQLMAAYAENNIEVIDSVQKIDRDRIIKATEALKTGYKNRFGTPVQPL